MFLDKIVYLAQGYYNPPIFETVMKICFFVDSIFSFGGVQRVTAVLAKLLAEDNDVTILTFDDAASEDTSLYEMNKVKMRYEYFQYPRVSRFVNLFSKAYSGIYKTLQLPGAFCSDIYGGTSFPRVQQKCLIETLNIGEYDVIIGVHAFLSLRLASVRSKLTCPKVIGWMHNSYQAYFEIANPYLPKLKHHFAHHMKHLDDVVVLCKDDVEQYKNHLGLQAHAIYNPLTLQPGSRSTGQSKRFIIVGRFTPKMKGFDIAIAAFSRFAQKHPEWTLEIVGDGPEKEKVQQWVLESGVAEKIVLTPFTKHIQQHYSAASCYILASRWEGFGLVLVEALSHGLSIICSELPVSKELLGGTSFTEFFPVEDVDALVGKMTVMADRDLTQLQEACVAKANEFSPQTIAQQWKRFLGL